MELMESGFGVRLDGIVGRDESPDEELPGEGNNGAISGEMSLEYGDRGGPGSTAGAAEIVSSPDGSEFVSEHAISIMVIVMVDARKLS